MSTAPCSWLRLGEPDNHAKARDSKLRTRNPRDRLRLHPARAAREPPDRARRPRRLRGCRAERLGAPAARRPRYAGVAREAVDYAILTHVHLDHAGGAGKLL